MSALHPNTLPQLPPVDEHVVAEGARAEIVDGHLVLTPPAQEPHGTKHFDLAYLLGAHVAPGYLGAVDLLVRAAVDQDFAPDASIFPAARDPDTGGRQLDVMAFEIVGEQALSVCTSKARALVARGVRRVFCIHIERPSARVQPRGLGCELSEHEHDEVLEWYRPVDGWARLERDVRIRDVCLAHPLPVAALLDATEADAAVVAALRARDSSALRELEREVFRRGQQSGRTQGLAAGVKRGLAAGIKRGLATGFEREQAALLEQGLAKDRQRVADLCEVLSVPLSDERRKQLDAMSQDELDALVSVLKARLPWPDPSDR